MSIFDEARTLEDLQTLVGSRARGRTKAAVRIEDISELVTIPPKLAAKRAEGETVTIAEFNALVDDMVKLHAVLQSVAAALQERIKP